MIMQGLFMMNMLILIVSWMPVTALMFKTTFSGK